MKVQFNPKTQVKSFTLLEVLIALILTGIVLSFLFGFFRHVSMAKAKNKIVKDKVLNVESCYLRLQSLFSHFSEDEGCWLVTLSIPEAKGPALLISCDEGLSPDPAFCGPIYNMLYVTKAHQLCLCCWTKEGGAVKVDTLLRKVEGISYAFFSDKKWSDTWSKNKTQGLANSAAFPLLMIKVSLALEKGNNNRHDFIFSLKEGEIMYESPKI